MTPQMKKLLDERKLLKIEPDMELVLKLFVKSGELEEKFIHSFEDAMDLREEADYGLESSESGAERVIEDAEDFMNRVKQILKFE
jgi:uncharacterized protein (UPF0332 family)